MNYNNHLAPKRLWTPEQRARQAKRIRQYRPWIKSTGPKTPEGRKASSRNAWKHGCYDANARAVLSYLAASRLILRVLRRKFDERDARRAVAPLVPAFDAVVYRHLASRCQGHARAGGGERAGTQLLFRKKQRFAILRGRQNIQR